VATETKRSGQSQFSARGPLYANIIRINGKDLEIIPEKQWLCVQVKPGTEFVVAAFCLKNRISFFIPLQVRYKSVVLPVWTNYIFCRLGPEQKRPLKNHYAVIRLLKPSDEEDLILHLKQFAPVNRVLPYYAKNDWVRVKTGALGGFLAKVEQVNYDKDEVKISINLMGRSVQVVRQLDEIDSVSKVRPAIILKPLTEIETAPPESGESEKASEPTTEGLNLHLEAISAEFIKYLARHPNLLYDIEPRRFEMLIAELLTDMGYEVELTPQSRDGGRDILAAFNLPHGKILTLVECKRFRPDRKIGIDILERFLWVLDRKDRASCGLIATTSYFSSEAIATEKEYKWRLGLKDFDGLRDWLSRYGMWTQNNNLGLWLPNSNQDLIKG